MPLAQLRLDGPVALIGDLHGESALLDRLLAALPPEATLVVLGDVCDRGPDTPGVMERLIARRALGVLGNHDLWFRDWALGRGFDEGALSAAMGGGATLAAYGVAADDPQEVARAWRQVPRAHAAWLAERPVAMDLEVAGVRWWVAHAGVPSPGAWPPGLAPAQIVPWLATERPSALLWPKVAPAFMPVLDRPVIMGHQPLSRPRDLGHLVMLDTGAGRGGGLSALLLPERALISVSPASGAPALDQHRPDRAGIGSNQP